MIGCGWMSLVEKTSIDTKVMHRGTAEYYPKSQGKTSLIPNAFRKLLRFIYTLEGLSTEG